MKYRFLFLVLALGVLFPELSFAADIFTPSSDDISIKILSQIFGGLLSGGVDAFGSGMSVYTGAVLSIGGVLAAYTILAGTIGTAHDGEMLGKKFSSVWIPIRYSVGTALILPVIPGGYCLAQSLVMWVIVQGVGLADKVWDAYRATPSVSANYKLSNSAKQQVTKLAEDAFIASSCVAAHAQYIQDTPNILSMLDRYDYRMAVDGDTYIYGDQKGVMSYLNSNMCGWVKLPSAVSNQTSATGAASNGTGKLGSFDNLFQGQDLSSIGVAHRAQTSILIAKMTKLAEQTVANRKDVPKQAKAYYAQIEAAADAYVTGVTAAAQGVVKGKGAAESNGYGWFLGGAYFTNDIVANDRINNAVNSVSTSGSSLDTAETTSTDADVEKYMVANQIISAHGAQYATRVSANNAKAQKEDAHKDSEFSIGGKVAAVFTDMMTGIDLYNLKNDSRHSIIIVNEMGNRLISLWSGAAIAMSALSIGAAVPLVGGGVSSFLSTVMGFLFLPITALGGTGFMCAYLIPNMPFILFLGAGAGWITECIISIIAAPLWIIMHLHPNGDDVHGKGGNGYMLVVELLLRPVMLIFGLIAGIVLSDVMGEFVNKVFFQVFSLSAGMGNGMVGFFMLIAGTVIYAYIQFGMLNKAFSLIHVIPDTLLRWMGGGSGSIGQAASQMGESAKGGFVAAAGVISRSGNAGGLDFKGKGGGGDDNKKIPPGKDGSGRIDDVRKGVQGSPENAPGALSDLGAKKQFDGKIESLGGVDSPRAQAFAQNLATERKENPDNTSSVQMDTAMKSTLNQEFGPGAGAMIKGFAGGHFSGEKFNEALSMYSKAKHNLAASGVTDKKEIASKLKEATVSARNAFTADKERKPLAHHLTKELSKFNEF